MCATGLPAVAVVLGTGHDCPTADRPRCHVENLSDAAGSLVERRFVRQSAQRETLGTDATARHERLSDRRTDQPDFGRRQPLLHPADARQTGRNRGRNGDADERNVGENAGDERHAHRLSLDRRAECRSRLLQRAVAARRYAAAGARNRKFALAVARTACPDHPSRYVRGSASARKPRHGCGHPTAQQPCRRPRRRTRAGAVFLRCQSGTVALLSANHHHGFGGVHQQQRRREPGKIAAVGGGKPRTADFPARTDCRRAESG